MQLDKIDFSNGMWRGFLTVEKSGASPTFSIELNGAVVEGTRISAGRSCPFAGKVGNSDTGVSQTYPKRGYVPPRYG